MAKKHLGKFIVFEGMEGTGKSTQIAKAQQHYLNQNKRVFRTREPGGTDLGNSIRNVLLRSHEFQISSISELFLMQAARAQHVEELLQPQLLKNDLVLCDRYIYSTFAYQGGGRNIDTSTIHQLNSLATNGLEADLVLVLDMPEDKALERANARLSKQKHTDREDRFEKENLSFHQTIRNAYLDMAQKSPHQFRVLDASLSIDKLHQNIIHAIDSFLVL